MATRKSKKTEATAEAQPTAQAAPQPQAGQQPAGLSLTDLITVTQIIQLSSQRGAFRAEEMEQVGALYTKLVAFLQSTGALTPPDAEEKKDA
jgi:hypothetical protein